MKQIKSFETNKKDNNTIHLENDDLVVLDDDDFRDEILDDFRLDEQVLILVIFEILYEIFLDDDLVVLGENLDDQVDEKI
jgi:hypothetical protein